ncbi:MULTISPECIES: oxidoreductase [unclassified Mesorhizobium]|uniref:oxidoreductase n=1 Tax=unclassified Mesorhizobium TaxID=325217 RepID=UPI001FEF8237|nr:MULTISPECIES: oxidoreductase [unclassified Mesorhizobium]
MGISVGEIGTECDRALWYTLHWASQPEQLDGRKLRLFQTGNLEEERLVADLERIGVEVYGQQDRIRLVSGFVRGKCDGKAMGIIEAPKTEHLLEFKSTNEKGMKELQKLKVKEAKPLHYGQCQIGMHAFGLSRCFYLAACKNTDTLYSERIEYDAEYCLRHLARVERLVLAAEPPSRISEKPDFFGCMFCSHKDVCHSGKWARVTCRSCVHSTPELGGDCHWSCARFSKPLSIDEQKAACPAHLYQPALVPGTVESVDEEAEQITYRLSNGELWTDGETREDTKDNAQEAA